MIGNIKNSMKGSYHSINSKHLPRYLAEFCYRFNRRFNLKDMMPRFFMRGDENATYEWKAPKNGGALWVIKKNYAYIIN